MLPSGTNAIPHGLASPLVTTDTRIRPPRPAANSHGPAPSVSTGPRPAPRPSPPCPPARPAAGWPAGAPAGTCCARPALLQTSAMNTASATLDAAAGTRIDEGEILITPAPWSERTRQYTPTSRPLTPREPARTLPCCRALVPPANAARQSWPSPLCRTMRMAKTIADRISMNSGKSSKNSTRSGPQCLLEAAERALPERHAARLPITKTTIPAQRGGIGGEGVEPDRAESQLACPGLGEGEIGRASCRE